MAKAEYPQETTDEVWEIHVQEGVGERWYNEEEAESEEAAKHQIEVFVQEIKDEVLSGHTHNKRKRFTAYVSVETDIEKEVARLRKMHENVRPKDAVKEEDYTRPPYPRFRIVHRVTETKADLVYDESEGFSVED